MSTFTSPSLNFAQTKHVIRNQQSITSTASIALDSAPPQPSLFHHPSEPRPRPTSRRRFPVHRLAAHVAPPVRLRARCGQHALSSSFRFPRPPGPPVPARPLRVGPVEDLRFRRRPERPGAAGEAEGLQGGHGRPVSRAARGGDPGGVREVQFPGAGADQRVPAGVQGGRAEDAGGALPESERHQGTEAVQGLRADSVQPGGFGGGILAVLF